MTYVLSLVLESLGQRTVSESNAVTQSTTGDTETDTDGVTKTTLFRIGRLLYGGILAMIAVDGLRSVEERAQYAESKNVPMAESATVTSHWLLLVGGVGISLWRFPTLAANAVIAFFAGVTPAIHNFWTIDDPAQRQQEMNQFLKNVALLGTALVFLGLAEQENQSAE